MIPVAPAAGRLHSLFGRFFGTWRHRDNGSLRDFQLQSIRRHPPGYRVVLHGENGPAQAAACYYLIAGLQGVEHSLPLLLAPLLRQDKQKVEDGEYKEERG